jgi:hypothetical protein
MAERLGPWQQRHRGVEGGDMKAPEYWKSHYVVATDPREIEAAMRVGHFASGGERFELLEFPTSAHAPNILMSQGSGAHPYVFAELAHRIHLAGFNVFVMPKHGGQTVDALVRRHRDAVQHIAATFNPTIGVYAEGLGAYVSFYLALAHAPIASIACENGPAIMTDPDYHQALVTDGGPWSGAARRRRWILPIARRLVKVTPGLPVPIWSYLDLGALIDRSEGVQQVETRLVDGYLHDPDFDRWYPLSAVMSLVTTPPSGPLDGLTTPTMFMIAREGPTPGYIGDLFERLPAVVKSTVDIDGGVYWMLSHPDAAAKIVCEWFATSLD